MLRAILYGWREWFVVVIICIYIVNIVVVMWRVKMLYVIHLQLANSRYICIKILRIMLCCVVIYDDETPPRRRRCIILIVFTILLVFFLFNLSLGYLIIVILFMVFCSIISWWLYLYIYTHIYVYCICTYIHSYIK